MFVNETIQRFCFALKSRDYFYRRFMRRHRRLEQGRHRVEWNSSCTREGVAVGREVVGLVEVYYQRYGGSDPAVAIICL